MREHQHSNLQHGDNRAFDERLDLELKAEQLKFFRRLNEERDRARHEDALNEALRKKGYPPLYPGNRRRRRS